eukprot:Colp12_sorted_trinity150504_noHs@26233
MFRRSNVLCKNLVGLLLDVLVSFTAWLAELSITLLFVTSSTEILSLLFLRVSLRHKFFVTHNITMDDALDARVAVVVWRRRAVVSLNVSKLRFLSPFFVFLFKPICLSFLHVYDLQVRFVIVPKFQNFNWFNLMVTYFLGRRCKKGIHILQKVIIVINL